MASADGTATAARRFADAHRTLVADSSVQFTMGPVRPPPAPPAWLERLGQWLHDLFAPIGRLLDRLFGWLPAGPWARILLGTVLALAAMALVAMIAIRVRDGQWRWPRRRTARAVMATMPDAEDWTPEAAPARALLAEADALAAQGRFAEAAHLLLRRSVEDIAAHRPQLVRPALTSRDLAAALAIPPVPRALFAQLAALVERSLFGGRAVAQGEWEVVRAAYAGFALPHSWSLAA